MEQRFEHGLIEAVHSRPFLYDHDHPKNKDIVSKAVAWKEISKICGASAERCLSRWKSLRDRYLREWKVTRDTNRKTKWLYFNSLAFLEKHLKTVKSNSITHVGYKRPLSSNEQSTSRMNDDSMEAVEQDHDYSSENFNIKQETQDMTTLNSTNSRESNQRAEKSRFTKTNEGEGSGTIDDILDEPEIEFDIVGTVNRFNDTIKAYKEVATLRLQRTEEENFGALVADMLSTLTVERRTRAKAHLMQYLAELHLQQIT